MLIIEGYESIIYVNGVSIALGQMADIDTGVAYLRQYHMYDVARIAEQCYKPSSLTTLVYICDEMSPTKHGLTSCHHFTSIKLIDSCTMTHCDMEVS